MRHRVSGRGHVVTIHSPEGVSEWECDAVAVCSGLNVSPRIPKFKGIERVPKVFHSSQMKTRRQFGEKTNVVVLGAGETGMDIAHLAITAPTKSVTLCHRDGFFCAPKVSQFSQTLNILICLDHSCTRGCEKRIQVTRRSPKQTS